MNKNRSSRINGVLWIVSGIIAVPIFFCLGMVLLLMLLSLPGSDDDGSPAGDMLLWLFSGVLGVFIGELGLLLIYLFHSAKRNAQKKQRLFGEDQYYKEDNSAWPPPPSDSIKQK